MNESHDVLEALDAIDPTALDYDEWMRIGMALKDAGHYASDWDTWSRRDAARYHEGECYRKWESFRGSNAPVTAGTIVAIARDHGWLPANDEGYELDWGDVIGAHDEQVVIKDPAWVEPEEIREPTSGWDPVKDLTTYLETLFEANENVGYVTSAWEKDGRYLPSKGNWDRTAGELIQALNRSGGDIGSVLGDYKDEAGAWIRFNPLDGHGCKNDNVTEFRFALVESDTMDLAKQNAIIRQLELPVACLVYSGSKSLHAIVHIDATDYDEYRKRVDYLYQVCRKNGLAIDSQNKNPSRLSRMPGVTRRGHKQFLMAVNIGRESWAEWKDWVEESTDVLPVDVTDFADEWDQELTPQVSIVDGIIGTNEKMMLSGPSKAGKSFALLELCAAIAEGQPWMGLSCRQGDVLYINLELKRDSRIRRLKAVYGAKGYGTKNLGRIHSLDLRGLSASLEHLAPKIVRQAARYKCSVIIIDPIYKVMVGDENSAEAVAKFCNQLDSLSRALDCSIIYCHHYSKGQQGQKASMDRASGSGVFARDVDALLAMTELDVTDDMRKAHFNELSCARMERFLDEHGPSGWRAGVSQDTLVVEKELRTVCTELLGLGGVMNDLIDELDAIEASVASATAWRLESTLREFAPHKPIDVWYRWPTHERDERGVLADAKLADVAALENLHRKGSEATKKRFETERVAKRHVFEQAVRNAKCGEPVTRQDVAGYIGEYDGKTVTKTTISNWMKNWPEYYISGAADGYVIRRREDGVCNNG